MAFTPGTLVYHDYGEITRVVHTRIVLGHVQGLDYLIRTPDGDMYVETLGGSNPDLVHFFVGPDDGTLPPGVPPGVVYGFPPMTMQQFQTVLADGRVETDAERARRGIPIALAVGVAVPGGEF